MKQKQKYIAIFLFLLPALLLFVGLLIAPIIMSIYYSLFNWNGLRALDPAKDFVGLKNYATLFNERIQFGSALKNAFILAGLSVFLQLPFYLEAPRSRYILKVNPAEGARQKPDRIHYIVHLL